MSEQHLIREIQQLKREVALLKEAVPSRGYRENDPYGSSRDEFITGVDDEPAGNPTDPTDIRAVLADLIKRVEALEDRPQMPPKKGFEKW